MDIDTILKTIYNAKELLKGYQLVTREGTVYTVQNKDVPRTSTTWKGNPPTVTEIILPDKTKVSVASITKAKLI